jgi:hypothetical protein
VRRLQAAGLVGAARCGVDNLVENVVTGQAFRAGYFDQALEYLAAQSDIWLTTSDEIAGHYRRTTGSA